MEAMFKVRPAEPSTVWSLSKGSDPFLLDSIIKMNIGAKEKAYFSFPKKC